MVITKLSQGVPHLQGQTNLERNEGVQEARKQLAKYYACPPVVFSRPHFLMVIASAFALGVTLGVILVRTALRL